MSTPPSLTDVAIRIETSAGALTMTPLTLLQYFLPDAKPMPNNPQVYVGKIPAKGGTFKDGYVQVEALAGMLLDAREKSLNPVSEMYLIASDSEYKKATHKIKYTVGIERARNIKGFLGFNSGLLVLRNEVLTETHGAFCLPGDNVLGAWAECYIEGLNRPIRHEVLLTEGERAAFIWRERGAFMTIKNCEDQLCYLKLGTRALAAPQENVPSEEGEIKLEAIEIPSTVAAEANPTPAASTPTPTKSDIPFEFKPGVEYGGTIAELVPRQQTNGKAAAGRITINTEHGPFTCFFFSRPPVLKEVEEKDWLSLIGYACIFTYVAKTDKAGRTWPRLDDPQAALTIHSGPQSSAQESGPEREIA